MINVDIKSLLGRLNSCCTRSLEAAAGLCVSRTHYEVTVEHFWMKLLEEPQSDLTLIFRHFNQDVGRIQKAVGETIEEFQTGNAGKPVFSPSASGMVAGGVARCFDRSHRKQGPLGGPPHRFLE